jgi:hypothetical protein
VRRYPLGGVVELRFNSVSFHCFRWQVLGFLCFFLLIFDLLCKRFSSPPCIGSAVVALFIKRDESLFCEKDTRHILENILSRNAPREGQ